MEYGPAYNYTMEKTALNAETALATAKTIGTGLSMAALGTNVIKTLVNKIQNDMRRKAIIEDLATYDPILKNVDREQIKEWFATMYYYAPTMTADKNTVKEILTGFARFGKIDLSTLKTLAETEEKLRKARNESPMSSLLAKMM